MNIDFIEDLAVRIIFEGDSTKSSSGVIFKADVPYIFTAKHAICAKDAAVCKDDSKNDCKNCRPKFLKTKITIDKPENSDFTPIKPSNILLHDSKDLAIIILKEKDALLFKNVPKIKAITHQTFDLSSTFLSCGYPELAETRLPKFVHYREFSTYRSKLYLKLDSSINTGDEITQDNLASNSGAGIYYKVDDKKLIAGIHTDTDTDEIFGEFIDNTIDDLLRSNKQPTIEFENAIENINTQIQKDFLKCFSPIEHDLTLGKNEVNLYTIKIEGNQISYDFLRDTLEECVRHYSLSRREIQKFKREDKIKKLINIGDTKFKSFDNPNKLGGLLLQGFIESHLKYPKLFSASEYKDTPYQGVFINLNSASDIELLHGIAEMGDKFKDVFEKALGDLMSNIQSNPQLTKITSSNIFDNSFTDDEKVILKRLLIPSETEESTDYIDSYGVFVGFNMKFDSDPIFLDSKEYRDSIHDEIREVVKHEFNKINKRVKDFAVKKSIINFFFVPFEDTSIFTDTFLERL